jgi:hypothetical protein
MYGQDPKYSQQDRGRWIANSQTQSLAMTPVGVLAIQNPASSVETRKAFVEHIRVSSNRFVTVEVGIVPSANVSGGTVVQQQPTISPNSQSYMICLVGNATSPIIISSAPIFETYFIDAVGNNKNPIDGKWIVEPGFSLIVRLTQDISGKASVGAEWRESL